MSSLILKYIWHSHLKLKKVVVGACGREVLAKFQFTIFFWGPTTDISKSLLDKRVVLETVLHVKTVLAIATRHAKTALELEVLELRFF